MTIEDLIKKGHFPRELPPPFTSSFFGDFYIKNGGLLPKPKKNSRGIKFSCPRLGLVRKMIVLTNPQHQTQLSECIISKWADIELHYSKSRLSFSKPINKGDRAANLPSFKDYKRKCFEESYYHKYELKTDISKYFPSIYTHSVPWALHTKAIAKANAASKTKDIGDYIDEFVRYTQYNQTIGLPIGPDTSHIISEIIGTSLDQHLQNKFPGLVGFRFVDDMYFYFQSYAEAELCLKEIQHIFKEYELQINGDKTKINKLPIGIEDEWLITLRKFNFKTSPSQQYHDLFSFFSLAFDFSQKHIDKFVLSYAIRRIGNEFIHHKNFSVYESMLLKTIQTESSALPDVLKILLSYKSLVNLDKLKNTLQSIIKYACPRAFDFEVAWALWYANTFKIKIDNEIAKELENLIDPITILMVLDLIDQKLINSTAINLTPWASQITADSLTDEKWILAYEISLRNWLVTNFDYIDLDADNKYYKILKDNGITFYDNTRQVTVKNDFSTTPTPEKINEQSVDVFEISEYDY